jgi:hypothetical protein
VIGIVSDGAMSSSLPLPYVVVQGLRPCREEEDDVLLGKYQIEDGHAAGPRGSYKY